MLGGSIVGDRGIQITNSSAGHTNYNAGTLRYAFRNYVGNITLRNTFGLSAFPFRTDTWDDVK